jgi:hypothetical protein
MADIRFPCSSCGETLKVMNAALVGKKYKCPDCGLFTIVPAPTADGSISTEAPRAAPPPEPVPEQWEDETADPGKKAPSKTGYILAGVGLLAVVALLVAAVLSGVFRSKARDGPGQGQHDQDKDGDRDPSRTVLDLPPRKDGEEARQKTFRANERKQRAVVEQQLVEALSQSPAARAIQGEELALFQQHTKRITQLAFPLRDSLVMASASADGTVKVWDLRTGTLKHDLTIQAGQPCYVAFSPNGELLATASEGGTKVSLWEVQTGNLRQELPARGKRIDAVAFLGGQLVCSGGQLFERWDVYRGKAEPYKQGDLGATGHFVIGHDDKVLASLGAEKEIHLWHPVTGKPYSRSFPSPAEPHLAFSPDGWSLALLDGAQAKGPGVSLGNLDTGAVTPLTVRAEAIRSLAFSPDEKWLALAGSVTGSRGTLQLWDLAANQEKRRIEPDYVADLTAIAISPGGTLLATGDSNGTILLWIVADLLTEVAPANVLAELHTVASLERKGRVLRVRLKPEATDAVMAQLRKVNFPIDLTLTNCPNLTEQGFAAVQYLKDLRGINLEGTTRVSDFWLAYLKDCVNLQHLNLRFCSRVSDLGLEKLSGLFSLETLDLGKTKITGEGLLHLKNLVHLRSLNLSFCELTDESLVNLAALSKLTELKLQKTGITDAALNHLSRLTEMEHLDLTGNEELAGSTLSSLSRMSHLEELSLLNTATTDPSLEGLKRLTNLARLDLSNTVVSDAGLTHLAALTRLQKLDLKDLKRLTGAGLQFLKPLPLLVELNLSQTGVTDSGLAGLKELTHLTSLDLSGTNVTDTGLVHLHGLKNLKVVKLTGTKVTEKGLAELKKALLDPSVVKP